MRKCTECKYLAKVDNGYSNWTVEGTDGVCLLEKHPTASWDLWYDNNPENEFAEHCNHYSSGDGPELDVEREKHSYFGEESLGEAYSDDPEIQELIDKVIADE